MSQPNTIDCLAIVACEWSEPSPEISIMENLHKI